MRVFGALTLAAVAIVATAWNPGTAHLEIATASAATAGWLDRLNSWRATTGLPNLTENTTWSSGDAAHAKYMVENDLVTHYETVGTPYYTVAGDTAARNGNINVSSTTSSTDESAIDWWMGAPFHAIGLMDPRLTTTGFGSYRRVKSGWQMGAAVDTLRGNPFTGGTYPVYFPGNGSTEPLTRYSGNEYPDPLQACAGYTMPAGLPVFVEVGGGVATKISTAHSFTGNGVQLAHCIIDSTTPNIGSNLTSRGGALLIPKAPLQTGVNYVVSMVVNNLPYTWSFNVGPFNVFNPLACTSATAVAAPPSPSAAATPVTITAASVGCPTPRYRFSIRPPGGVMTLVQDYSASATYVWNTPVTPGAYSIQVDARDNTSTIPRDATTSLTYSLLGCQSGNMTPDVASPQPTGASVTFTATSTGCGAAPQYKFFVDPPGATGWTAKTGFGGATWLWNTTGLPRGVYGVGVWVRATGSTSQYESYWLGTYTLTFAYCKSAIASPAANPPVAPGTSVSWTGTALGCGSPQYKYFVQAPGGAMLMKRDYGSAGWAWNTAGLPVGTYQIGIWSRQTGSTHTYDAYGQTTFRLGSGNCTSAGVAPNMAAPQQSGATISVLGSSNSCTSPQYQFLLKRPGGAWTVKQAFGASATWNWNTTGYTQGQYQLGVWVKQAGSTASYDAYAITDFQLAVGTCASANLSPSPASPQIPGTSITLTASSTGCTAPRYEFWRLAPGSTTWQSLGAYSAGTTFVWATAGLIGPYRFGVWAKQNGSPNSYDTFAQTTFWVGS